MDKSDTQILDLRTVADLRALLTKQAPIPTLESDAAAWGRFIVAVVGLLKSQLPFTKGFQTLRRTFNVGSRLGPDEIWSTTPDLFDYSPGAIELVEKRCITFIAHTHRLKPGPGADPLTHYQEERLVLTDQGKLGWLKLRFHTHPKSYPVQHMEQVICEFISENDLVLHLDEHKTLRATFLRMLLNCYHATAASQEGHLQKTRRSASLLDILSLEALGSEWSEATQV